MKSTRLLVVDNHSIFRKGVIMCLSHEPTINIVGEAKNSQEAIRQAETLQPNVVLMDLMMPNGNGIETNC